MGLMSVYISVRSRVLIAIILLVMILVVQITFKSNPYMDKTESNVQVTSIHKMSCTTGIPCTYPETVNFRIIVLTFNRPESLLKLLESLNTVLLDGDSARLEIWIDRDTRGKVSNSSVAVAEQFKWLHGPTRVHIQTYHAGLYGQWIDTWTPSDPFAIPGELSVFLEDDITVSPYIYRWIKAVHDHYGPRVDFAGCTLASDTYTSHSMRPGTLTAPKNHTTFMYRGFGTWGFSPSPRHWWDFQRWYHGIHTQRDFHPYVKDTIATNWYKNYERSGRTENMWSMWFLYYMNQRDLFTVYNNLKKFNGDNRSCLCINRRERGLNTKSKGNETFCRLLANWNQNYTEFKVTNKLNWNGNTM